MPTFTTTNRATQTHITDLRNKAKNFATRYIAPLAEAIDKETLCLRTLWPKLGQHNLLGITVEKSLGGLGMGYLEHAVVMEEISRASASVGLSYGAHSNLCIHQIQHHGTSAQKQKYLPKLISGEHMGALAMSEPDAGSDVLNMQLVATKKTGHYLLEGKKRWITNGMTADIIVVYAKTTPEAGPHGISAFIVETQSPGFSAINKFNKLGMRGSNTCELLFEAYKLPHENLLGQENQGIRILMDGLNYERVILAAGPVGIMQACLDVVLPYVRSRQQFGRTIGQFQLIQAKLADIYTHLSASRAYLYAVAQACDRGQITRKEAAGVILYTSERATQVALQAIQCLGGNGYIDDYPTGRLLRDAKLYEIGAGTSEIRRMVIGKDLQNDDLPSNKNKVSSDD